MIEHLEHEVCQGEEGEKRTSLLDNLRTLRSEAGELKECFNRQCFQAIAVISLFYIYLFHFMFHYKDDHVFIDFSIGIAAYISILLIITVLNVGIYKFEGANRIIGYILFLERQNISKNPQIDNSLLVKWETLIKAWRIFHPTVENSLYIRWSKSDKKRFKESLKSRKSILKNIWVFLKIQFNKGKLKKEAKDGCIYRWYLPDCLVHSEGEYSPGNYLRRMMFMLHLLGAIAYLIIFLATFFGHFSSPIKLFFILLFFASSYYIFIFMIYRPYNLSVRIEKGLFCIHSAAIFWAVVSKAHERTLSIIDAERSLKHYSFILSCLALHFAEYGIDRAHEWCQNTEHLDIANFISKAIKAEYPIQLQNIFNENITKFSCV